MPDASPIPVRRSILLEAARDSFRAAAYDDVGLREVGAVARLDVGQIVREFGSKEELFASVLANVIADVPSDPAPRWAKKITEELLRGEGPHTEPFRLIAFSGASPKLTGLIRVQVLAAIDKLAASLEPGEGLKLRASLAGALIIGQIIRTEMLSVGPSSPAEIRLAKQFLGEALDVLRRAPQLPDTSGRPFGVTETRAAILAAARLEFSRLGYEHATVRGIASTAGADPALVIRYFYSKENLFYETLKTFFDPLGRRPSSGMLVDWMILSALVGDESERGSAQHIMLRSASSPIARQILGTDLASRFHEPLAKALGGPHAELRVALMLAVVGGVQFCRSIIGLDQTPSDRGQEVTHLRAVLQSLAGPL